MAKFFNPSLIIPSSFTIILLLSHLISFLSKIVSYPSTWIKPKIKTNSHLTEILHVATRLRTDPEAMGAASTDFGKAITLSPAAVFFPTSINDVVSLVKLSNNLATGPFAVATRGRGHSLNGQAMAEKNGVVIELTSLNNSSTKIRVFRNPNYGICEEDLRLGFVGFVDVGGEQLWIDVLNACIKEDLAPVSWTDYLYLTVGGTLSNAGISGQTFRFGPQICCVRELDVITGKGELIRCSREEESELFNGVLGGLGQFGIISRARILLQPAPKRVKWIRMLYVDFETFARDQEILISNNKDVQGILNGLNYIEGTLMFPKTSSPNNWRSDFFSLDDLTRISSLQTPNGIIYCLEVAKYYDPSYNKFIDEEVEELLKGLEFLQGFIFRKDLSYFRFLNRVREGEKELEAKGLWNVPHPWLNLFVPKSQISDFNSHIFVNILAKQAKIIGPMLVYPMNHDKWDDKMSASIPEEEVFYTVGLLHSSTNDEWKALYEQNKDILRLCEGKGIMIKQYLPHNYEGLASSKEEFWKKHFGKKWRKFVDNKSRFDPNMILSPGQRIFN
ncbi:hypothetical protein V2J09_012356 [Rumex salicifolius]